VEACLSLEGVHLHLYGKAMTAPFRKMGHVTATGETLEAALEKAAKVKDWLKAETKESVQ
jgi:5-(carboxyamino)imidazole ribonucleotide synthase